MVMIGSLCRRANVIRSGTRAIVPSFLLISQITPAGARPAIRARSTAASVWPARTSVPPSRARSGKMCPGLTRSRAVVAGSMATRIVIARSGAETPVATCLASIGTHIGVSRRDELSDTASGISSASSRSGVIARQSSPRAWVIMKLTASGVTRSAAIVRSPSFSRSSSSTTTIIPPARIAASASSIDENGRRRTAWARLRRARRPASARRALPSTRRRPCRRWTWFS